MVLIDVRYRLKEGVTTHAAAVTFAVDDDPDMLSFDGNIHGKLGSIPCPTLSRVKLLYTFHVLLRIATFLKAAAYGDSTIFCAVKETPQFVRSS